MIMANAAFDYLFNHWEVIEGSCKIQNTKKIATKVYDISSNCTVMPIFSLGFLYAITETPTLYNFTEHLYAKFVTSGVSGVRFFFKPITPGDYTLVISNGLTQDSLKYLRYTSLHYTSISKSQTFCGTFSETIHFNQDTDLYIIIANTTENPNNFWISIASQSYKLKFSSDGHGTVMPANGYDSAFANSKYTVYAKGDFGYRFADWQTITGSPTIDDRVAASTFVTVKGNTELKARFKPGEIYSVSTQKQTFNFKKNYYTESTQSTIRFTWTPPDTMPYIVNFGVADSIRGTYTGYNEDGSFRNSSIPQLTSGSKYFLVKGTAGTPLYWTFRENSTGIPDLSFTSWISTPAILDVNATKGGATSPSGRQYTNPGSKFTITAWPHGGYEFSSWVPTKCNLTLGDSKKSKTSVIQTEQQCSVEAQFIEDTSAIPSLTISNLDIGNYPEICAQVSATDKNSGLSFYGLGEDDLQLWQDGIAIKPQVTSITNVSGISVVIVVDESPSMEYNDRMIKAKDAIKSFIHNMGTYDRTALVGFRGYRDSTIVLQSMTSNKSQLLKAVEKLTTYGNGTNIITGAYAGLRQIRNETNPTAVIIFSDGENNDGTIALETAINLGKSKKTVIHSIGVETEASYPLEDLAKQTGGMFTTTNDASELSGIYEAIRDNINSQYLVCYQAPDTLQDGETHDVVIGMTFNNTDARDTVQWNKGGHPPSIALTEDTWNLVNNTQPENNPLTIGVYIQSKIKINSADLYLRTSGTSNSVFAKYTLKNTRDSLWEYTVPANLVVAPGLDFYVIATDSLGQTGKSPKIQTPAMEPYTIFVGNDIPDVKTASIACKDTTGFKKFSFSIKDSDDISSAKLYFRDSRTVIFQEAILAYSFVDDTWSAEIYVPSSVYSTINYYLRATDTWGATVRVPGHEYFTTDACGNNSTINPNDTSVTDQDTIPEDTVKYTQRDSIEYSLIADSAEIYDKDLDGRADFVRIHFKEEHDDNISSIDSIFWNSNYAQWRYATKDAIKKNRQDGKWVEAYINEPFGYGLTMADSARKPFLSFSTPLSNKLENVKLSDKVGAVPARATLHPGEMNLAKYMDPSSNDPPDTLVIQMSEPIIGSGTDNAWEKLFRYSSTCKDSTSQPLITSQPPAVSENGTQWAFVLDRHFIKTGFCLHTDPEADFIDMAGNALGRGEVKINGTDGLIYLTEIRPLQPISGFGPRPNWISPDGSRWEELPDTLSAISVRTVLPYTANIYIFDALSVYVDNFEQKFGYNGEMEDPKRDSPDEQSKQGFLYWDEHSKKGRKAGTGVYIWRIFFTFDDGHKEAITVKTGIMRREQK